MKNKILTTTFLGCSLLFVACGNQNSKDVGGEIDENLTETRIEANNFVEHKTEDLKEMLQKDENTIEESLKEVNEETRQSLEMLKLEIRELSNKIEDASEEEIEELKEEAKELNKKIKEELNK